MKLTFILAIILFASCKKEDPVCYTCQYREGNTTKVYTACGDKPDPSFTNANGDIIFVTCVRKN